MGAYLLEYARRRLTAFLETVNLVAQSEFPYPDSEAALHQLKYLFERKLDRLRQLDASSNPDVVTQECTLSLASLARYLQRLGFILRSTNVRNAFELYGPILRLAQAILEPTLPKNLRKTKLLLSSEWDYSLLIFREDPELPNFLLIGLPAHESSNPLLVPLVGHELGHSVWAKMRLHADFSPIVQQAVTDSICESHHWPQFLTLFNLTGIQQSDLTINIEATKAWQESHRWALKQAEESFCDFLGLKLFGTSFLNAFAYLLSPSHGSHRTPVYPDLAVRVRNHETAAKNSQISVPADYAKMFRADKQLHLTPTDEFRLRIADEALQRVVDKLLQKASDILRVGGLPIYTEESVDDVAAQLSQLVPAEGCSSLSQILNAAWSIYDSYPNKWERIPQVKDNKARVLEELVLKTIEVFEIETIQKENA